MSKRNNHMRSKVLRLEKDYEPKPYIMGGFSCSTIDTIHDLEDPIQHEELMKLASPLFDEDLKTYQAFHKDNKGVVASFGAHFISQHWLAYLHHIGIYKLFNESARPAYIRDEEKCISQWQYLNGDIKMPQVDLTTLQLLPEDILPVVGEAQ